jgi:hypothetical protein
MFGTLSGLVPKDRDYPERVWTLEVMQRVLAGTLYDALPYEFQDERMGSGEYIPLRMRRPSVRYPLARIVVDDSLSLVFGEGHFPALDSADRTVRQVLGDMAREARLNQVMLEAGLRGSVGSVAILLRVLRGRVFFRVLETQFLTPAWDAGAPDELVSVTEKYKVRGAVLIGQGYDVPEPNADYWFMRRWDREREVWFKPWPVSGAGKPAVDEKRTVRHGLGFVPIVWVRNLPGGDDIDGACTFRPAVETSIEIDYQLSQAGRGLKYSSDPTLLVREPAMPDGDVIKGGGNALVVGEGGDAKLLQIDGHATSAVIEYVRTLRELALEGVHGNRASADRIAAAQSGRALELMNQGLIFLADNLRVSYGDAMLQLARMVLRASERFSLRLAGAEIPALDIHAPLNLVWPRWYAPSADDRAKDAQTLSKLAQAGQISRETAVKSIAGTYDIDDVGAELARIAAEAASGGAASERVNDTDLDAG